MYHAEWGVSSVVAAVVFTGLMTKSHHFPWNLESAGTTLLFVLLVARVSSAGRCSTPTCTRRSWDLGAISSLKFGN
jgi:hypothetical protein